MSGGLSGTPRAKSNSPRMAPLLTNGVPSPALSMSPSSPPQPAATGASVGTSKMNRQVERLFRVGNLFLIIVHLGIASASAGMRSEPDGPARPRCPSSGGAKADSAVPQRRRQVRAARPLAAKERVSPSGNVLLPWRDLLLRGGAAEQTLAEVGPARGRLQPLCQRFPPLVIGWPAVTAKGICRGSGPCESAFRPRSG